MVVHHTTSIIANILSTIESYTNSENDSEGSQLSTDIEEWSKDLGKHEDVSIVERDNSTTTGATVEGQKNSVTGCFSSNIYNSQERY